MAELEQQTTVTSRYRLLRKTILIVTVLACGFGFVYRLFNPTDRNHIVVINSSGHEFVGPFAATLDGEVFWTHQLEAAAFGTGNIRVYNLDDAFFGGALTVTDAGGKTLIDTRITPPARYAGSLVIRVLPDGKASHAFNANPFDDSKIDTLD